MIGVYKILTSAGNYYGSTTNFEYRRNLHLHHLRHGIHINRKLQAAFNHDGEADITIEMIRECDIDRANTLEKRFCRQDPTCLNQTLNPAATKQANYHKRKVTVEQIKKIYYYSEIKKMPTSFVSQITGVCQNLVRYYRKHFYGRYSWVLGESYAN